MGYQLIGVSPEKFGLVDILAAEEDLNYPLYSDPEVKLIEAFGLGWKVSPEKVQKYGQSKKEGLQAFAESELVPKPHNLRTKLLFICSCVIGL